MRSLIFVDEPYGCEAIEFYKAVFDATELNRVYENVDTNDEVKGIVRVVSCELQFGCSCVIVSEFAPNSSRLKKGKAPRGRMVVYMQDVASVVDMAQQLGACIENDVTNEDGVRYVDIRDPYGNAWSIRPGSMMFEFAGEGTSTEHDPTSQDIVPKE